MALTQISTQGIKDGTITGTDLATNVDLVDNQKLRLGNSQNLQIYYDASSYITNSTAGHLIIKTINGGSDINLECADDFFVKTGVTQNSIIARDSGQVELYYSGSKKFETTSSGATITGTLIADGLTLYDNEKLLIGNNTDIEVFHDGTNSIFQSDTGDLQINSGNSAGNVEINVNNNVAGNTRETSAKFIKNGAVELYHDNSKKLETTSDGVAVTGQLSLTADLNMEDGDQIEMGTDNDFKIFHSGFNYLESHNDVEVHINAYTGGSTENMAKFKPNGAVELYHDNSKKLETTSYGAFVNGRLSLDDSNKITLGDSMDLQIYHDGSNSYISESGTGDLIIESSHIVFKDNGTEVFETTNTGARLVDNMKLLFGSGNDLEIFHNGFNSKIADVGTGALILSGSTVKIENGASSENQAVFNEDGAVELYYDNSKKFETRSTGVLVSGSLTADGGNAITLGDNKKIVLGTGSDLQIYHDGSNSVIAAANTGDLQIFAQADDILLQAADNIFIKPLNGESGLNVLSNGAVELYHNNVKKIFTEAEGASVCGDGSDVHLRLRDSSDNVRGIVHATASVDVGFITADATAWLFRVHDDGSYQHYGSEISDRDKKDNITTISSTSLDKVTKLVPKTFTFKQDETGKVPTDKVFTGFIAQEVKEHLPNLVTGTDGQKDMTVDYNGILAHAVKAITELSAEVEILKTKVAALEAA